MKYIVYTLFLFVFLSCKKEKQAPPELLGKWKMNYKQHFIFDAGISTTWIDTIYSNNKTFEFFQDWKVKTNKYFPNCVGEYSLSNNNKHIKISFDCNNALLDYTIFKNISDTLILQKDDGIDLYKEIYIKQ